MFTETINLRKEPTEHGFMPTLKTYIIEKLEEDTPRPAMIVFPGGGYWSCSPREAERIAISYNAGGYQAFVLNYCIKPHKHPDPIIDAKNAVKYVRENAERYNIDSNKIAVIGFSAGAHLAASISNLWNCDKIFDKAEIESELAKPNASLLCYPVLTSGEFAHRGSFNNLLGEDAKDELLELMSLEKQVSHNTPPTFLWHTQADGTVPVENSLLYAMALSKYKIPCELHVFPRGTHGLALVSDETVWSVPKFSRRYEWLSLSFDWLNEIFELKK